MRKLLNIIALGVIAISSPTIAIGCTFRKHFNGKDGVLDVDDYDWSLTNSYSLSGRRIKDYSNFKANSNLNVTPDNIGSSINWNYIQTGYHNVDQINQQSATGAPLENNFNFTGNVKADYGFTGMDAMYQNINSVLDWTPENDADAKYNRSTVPLQPRQTVGKKWTSSQSTNINFTNMGRMYNGRFNGVDGNFTILNQQKINQQSFNNWQYIDNYVSWRGDIGIPNGEFVDYAHTNGTKVYGLLYLDGFNGLKPGMITDLLKQDSSGNYLIVNKLIEMADYYGFDGWFINEEANGAFIQEQPVLKYEQMVDILHQFEIQADEIAKQTGKDIRIMAYTNSGTLEYKDGVPINSKSALYATNADEFLTDFGDIAASNVSYTDSHANNNVKADNDSLVYDEKVNTNFDIYNMWNAGSNANHIGEYYPVPDKNLYWDQLALDENNKAINSMAIFGAQVAWEKTQNSFWGQIEGDNFVPKAPDSIGQDIQRILHTEDIDTSIYTGKDATVLNSWYEKALASSNSADDLHIDANQQKSFGVANLVQEKTTLINGIDHFKTSFSIGQGKKFIDANHVALNDDDGYTWYNRGLADVQPTYKWDIYYQDNDSSPQPLYRSDNSTKVKGYYDFDEVYEKGNSIALGSSYYNEADTKRPGGAILDAEFDANKKYCWNIMGANLNDNKDYTLTIVYKVTQDGEITSEAKSIQQEEIRPLINDEIKQFATKITDANGWTTATININSSELISKIGISYSSSAAKNFKLNIGQIRLEASPVTSQDIDSAKITNFESEYTILRENSNKLNIRMQWDAPTDVDVDYYEIYYKLNGKIYRYGETNHTNYWMGDIDVTNIVNNSQNNANFEIFIRPISNNAAATTYTKINLDISGGIV